ncbi:MAG: hypothetical protein M3144_11050, partial [Actinomycetota bacterium]|nr:hypothetical protein [Actinomycetota bacterium]
MDSIGDHLLKGGKWKRSQPQMAQPVLRKGAIKAKADGCLLRGAGTGDDADRQIRQPADSELDYPGGWFVQRLHVVHGDDERRPPSQSGEDGHEASRQCPRVGTAASGPARSRTTSRARRWGPGSASSAWG